MLTDTKTWTRLARPAGACDAQEHTDMPTERAHTPRNRRRESPEARRERVEAIKRAIESGTYDTPERARLAVEAMLQRLAER